MSQPRSQDLDGQSRSSGNEVDVETYVKKKNLPPARVNDIFSMCWTGSRLFFKDNLKDNRKVSFGLVTSATACICHVCFDISKFYRPEST